MSREVVIVSDIHMGDPDFPQIRKQLFFDFLEHYVKPKAEELILLGDILELSQGSLVDVYKGNLDLMLKLSEIANQGIKLTYLLGNHDLDFTNVKGIDIILPNLEIRLPKEQKVILRQEVPDRRRTAKPREVVPTPTSAFEREIKGQKVYLAHGHEYNHYFAGNPKKFDAWIKVGGLIEEVFGAEVDDEMLDFFEGAKKGLADLFYSSETTPGKKGLGGQVTSDVLAARDILKYEIEGNGMVARKSKLDVVVFGHTHRAMQVQVKDDIKGWKGDEVGAYLNTGAWVITQPSASFATFKDDGTYAVSHYTGQGQSEELGWWRPKYAG